MLKQYLALIRNRNFRNLWLGQITSQIALNMLYFVLAIKVYQDTRSNAAVSYMILAFGIPSIIFGIVAGGIVDKCNKRSVLLLSNIIRVFILVLFYLFLNNIFLIYLFTVIISVITQFFIPAEAPSISFLVASDLLLTANSLFTVSFYVSTLMGFVLAGPFIKIFGPSNVYLFMAVLMGIASYFVYKLPNIGQQLDNIKNLVDFKTIRLNILEGIHYIFSHERVKQSLILMTFSQALIATLSVLAPGFADRILSIDLADASYLVMGPAAIGLILGAIWVGGYGMKYLKGTLILIGIIASGVTLLLLSLLTRAKAPSIVFFIKDSHFIISNLAVAIVLLLLMGFFNSLINVPSSTILQEDSESDIRGRVYGVLTSLTGGVSFLPVVFSGILADILGVGSALFILAIIILLIGFYQYLKRREVNNIIK
ncbi:MFS transporter [Candidatus Gottesmanbacteria bacterium]|nr:MFS transporter [Candidatus Gottesmanbacteria bacterium]